MKIRENLLEIAETVWYLHEYSAERYTERKWEMAVTGQLGIEFVPTTLGYDKSVGNFIHVGRWNGFSTEMNLLAWNRQTISKKIK